MDAAKSDYLERKILDHVLGVAAYTMPTSVYLALYTSNPNEDSSGAEVTGGSYTRQLVTFNAASTDVSNVSTSTSSNQVVFGSMPTAVVTHAAICDAANGGNVLYYMTLAASKSLTAGDDLTIDAGDISVIEK